MRVFVTGASGFIGSAIVQELLSAGHQVLGLVRSDASAATLAQQGAAVHRGDLNDLSSLTAGAQACDAVIHTAFIHDFANFAASCETDRTAIEAIINALAGTGKAFVSTSGIALIAPGGIGTENDGHTTNPQASPRAATEQIVLNAADKGVRSSLVRLPPSVHGAGDHGFVPVLIEVARTKGFAAFIGDGANRWPAVHRFDAARLYRLAVENAAAGPRLHAVAEEGIPMRDIAATIGTALGLPVRSIAASEAKDHFGWIGHFSAIDCPATSTITRNTLGWNPEGPELLADMKANYFA